MRNLFTTVLVVGVLAIVPGVGFAATAGLAPAQSAAKRSSNPAVPSHATSGVVKSVNPTTLVITRAGKHAGEMTFAVNPSTNRGGTVEVGSSVSVRYREEGKTYVATAITAQHAKQQAGHKRPSIR